MCVYEAHVGPVRTLHRHPQLPKIFCTIGDWSANIWAEDVRESPILSLKSAALPVDKQMNEIRAYLVQVGSSVFVS